MSATRTDKQRAATREGGSDEADPIAGIAPERVAEAAEPTKQAAGLTAASGELIDPRDVAEELEGRSAEETIAWALETFHPRLRFATSFQKTSSVAIDIAHQLEPTANFFYLDTDVLFEETYTTRDALAARYGIEFQRYAGVSLTEQEDLYGARLWERQPDACCGIRKVEPMREALSGIDCWVSGIRREDSSTRAGAAKFGWDRRFGLWKLNPLADWTERQVWDYINDRELPYNPLHDAGYPSIGCTHCTRPPGASGDPRSGRWADAHKTECGLHG
ncbi:MAG TPA: phosphoadenylyl-sulfate reductase [Solirubrobacterales bacterium]|nr:phosphoadenylyl-sulfate reductase [Solirubrobacterales bacterium]